MSNLPTVTRHLPIPLSESRKVEVGQELAEHVTERKRLQRIRKEQAKAQDEAIKTRSTEIEKLADTLHQGFEMRPVICQQEMDLDHNTFVVKRIDTGEIVEERPLTAEDHEDPDAQLTLGKAIKDAQEQVV